MEDMNNTLPESPTHSLTEVQILTAELAIARGNISSAFILTHDLRTLRDLQAARIKVLEDALLKVRERGCSCYAQHHPHWHSPDCMMRLVDAALAVESEGSEVEP